MATIPDGSTVTWEVGQPNTYCLLCQKHRRGLNESKSNGTTGHIKVKGRGQVCGDCAQQIKALAP